RNFHPVSLIPCPTYQKPPSPCGDDGCTIYQLPAESIAVAHHIPVDDLPELLQVIRTAVLVVEIVRVFPYIKSQDRRQTFGQRVSCIRLLLDREFAVGILGQPDPSRTENGDTGSIELLLELVERTKLGVDGLCQLPLGFSTAIGLEGGEVEVVIEDLSGIVEDGSAALLHDGFQVCI